MPVIGRSLNCDELHNGYSKYELWSSAGRERSACANDVRIRSNDQLVVKPRLPTA